MAERGRPEPYLELRARAVRLLEAHGGQVDEPTLLGHVLGAGSGEPWRRMLATILAGEERLRRGADGVWRLAESRGAPDGALPADCVVLELGLMGSRGHRLQVVDVAALRVRSGEVVARFVATLRPATRPTGYAQRAARLDLEAFAAAQPFEEVADDLLAFLGCDTLIGFDLAPQVAALTVELRRVGRGALRNGQSDLQAWLLRRGLIVGKPSLQAALRALGAAAPATSRVADRAASLVRLLDAARDVTLAGGESLQLRSPEATLVAQTGSRPRDAAQPAPAASRHGESPSETGAPDRPSAGLTWQDDPPPAPGVYYLRDAHGVPLYVGTARDLRQRLRSYRSLAVRQARRMEGLHAQAASVTWETTPSELSARLLEAQRIAELSPRYNVQRRPARPRPYVVVRLNGAYLGLHVAAQPAVGERCAGPFPSARAAEGARRVLADVFSLHTCRRRFGARRPRPPCERHTLQRLCPAPCVGAITPAGYQRAVEAALRFLAGEREATLQAMRGALGVAQRSGRTAEVERLGPLIVAARGLPTVAVVAAAPTLLVGLVRAVSGDDTWTAWDETPAEAELFCLHGDALFPLCAVSQPHDPAQVAGACRAALAAAPLDHVAATVARTWLRQRPTAAVVAETSDLTPAGLAAVAQVLASRWAEAARPRSSDPARSAGFPL